MSKPAAQPRFQSAERRRLGDFTADRRVLIIALAIVVGSGGVMRA